MRVAAPLLFASFACATSALRAQLPARFAPYEHCTIANGPTLIEDTPLAQGVEGRTVKTVMGAKNVPLAGGTRLLYAWPGTEPFANVKVEAIPADGYRQARLDLTDNFQQILTADDSSERNYALKPRLNGLEIYGLDRKKLEGGVLGIYIFFNERSHIITTVYFLNQEPNLRKFQSLQEYAALRDAFLESFTACASGRPLRVAAGAPALPAAPAPNLPSVPAPATSNLAAPTLGTGKPPAPVATLPDLPNAPAAAPAAVTSAPAAAASAEIQPSPTKAVVPPVPTPPASSAVAAPVPEPYVPADAAPLVHAPAAEKPVSASPSMGLPEAAIPPAAHPSEAPPGTAGEPYIPPEAAPLVHPRNAADRKSAAAKTKAGAPKKKAGATSPRKTAEGTN
jgi:hypothetical protein